MEVTKKETAMSSPMILFGVFCLTLPVFIDGQNNQPFEMLYENPSNNFPLQNIEFDLQTNNFFVSGKNVLYKFINDTLRETKRTGPEAKCLESLSEEDNRAYCGDDYNSVMVVTTDSIITCSTLKGGLCVRRNKETLDPEKSSEKIRLVSNENSPAVGIFLNLNVSDSGGQKNIILFAKQYTLLPLPLVNLEKSVILSVSPELSTKDLGNSDFGENFDLFLRSPEKQTMNYRVVMENENFVFLLVNQNSKSKLVKICKTIDSSSSKKAYEDIPIICNKDGVNLTYVEHGIFVTVDGEKLLVVLFSNLTTEQSSVCVFKESEIFEAFLKSRKHRFGCPKHDLKETDVILEDEPDIIATSFNLQKCTPFPFNKTDEVNV